MKDLQTQNTICGVRTFYLYLCLILHPRTQDYGRNIWPLLAQSSLGLSPPALQGEQLTLGQTLLCNTKVLFKLKGKVIAEFKIVNTAPYILFLF